MNKVQLRLVSHTLLETIDFLLDMGEAMKEKNPLYMIAAMADTPNSTALGFIGIMAGHDMIDNDEVIAFMFDLYRRERNQEMPKEAKNVFERLARKVLERASEVYLDTLTSEGITLPPKRV